MSATITMHLDSATLMSYAAGSLGETLSAAVAAHVGMCPHCREELALLESFGAALMETSVSMQPSNVQTLRRPLESENCGAKAKRFPDRVADDALPEPIARAFGLTMDSVPWKRLGPGIWHHRLPVSAGATGDLRLLKIAAGRRMPEHGHNGVELTLVLDGAFADATGTYERGDIQDVGEEVEHRPVADALRGCICLVASERPARFKGLISRLVQPFTGL